MLQKVNSTNVWDLFHELTSWLVAILHYLHSSPACYCHTDWEKERERDHMSKELTKFPRQLTCAITSCKKFTIPHFNFSAISKSFPFKDLHELKYTDSWKQNENTLVKGAVSRYSVHFLRFFARGKNGDCSRKCRGHHTMTARSAARTASPAKLSRENVVFLEQLSFSAALPCGRHYFSPHKMAAKNHRLSWHCCFNCQKRNYRQKTIFFFFFFKFFLSDQRPIYYSETRLLRTLKGNEKRYVVTKVRSIQNAIFLTGRTGSTCSRERTATEDASPSWMSFIIRFSFGEIAFQGILNLKTCRENWNRNLKGGSHARDQKKKNQRKGKKVLLEGKLVRNIRFCATFCTSYPKKMYMFSDWRCPWSTERTL